MASLSGRKGSPVKKVFLISDMCQLSTDANHLSDAQHIQNKQEVAQK